jgi:hypothetical protein
MVREEVLEEEVVEEVEVVEVVEEARAARAVVEETARAMVEDHLAARAARAKLPQKLHRKGVHSKRKC